MQLLDARRFRKYLRSGGKLRRRQDMTRECPWVVSTADEVQSLLADMGAMERNKGGTSVVSYPEIGTLSYA